MKSVYRDRFVDEFRPAENVLYERLSIVVFTESTAFHNALLRSSNCSRIRAAKPMFPYYFVLPYLPQRYL